MLSEFPDLKLPAIEPRLATEEDNTFIFDPVRKKFVLLTKEEWVRQHFVGLLINHLFYPRSLLKVESGLYYGQKQKRSDILVYNQAAKPHLLVECKAWNQKIRRNVVEQASVYNKTLQARYLAVSNGFSHFCWELKKDHYLPLSSLPPYR